MRILLAAAVGTITLLPDSGHAQAAHALELSSYAARFSTYIPRGPLVSVLSPLGAQVGYAFHHKYTSSYYVQYNMLSTGRAVMLQGLSAGYDFALFGGHEGRASIARNTQILTTFPRRLGAFAAGAMRLYNLTGIVPVLENDLIPVVPATGQFLGMEAGLSYEQQLFRNTRLTSRTSILLPWFLKTAEQKGAVISLAAGIGATL